MDDSYLLIDYVYLDSEERKRFAQASHEYLIEQLQFTGSESLSTTTNKFRLNFNHPSKFLLWVPHLTKYVNGSKFVAYDEDMEAARERFAKLVWLASRAGITGSGSNWTVSVTGNEGEVTSPAKAPTGLSAALSAVADKVTAQLLFANNDAAGNTGNPAPATVDNVVLLANNVTAADMSVAVSTYNSSFLEAHGVTVWEHFNYAENLDRSGNPVKSAKLQLNGHDRFQERDGHYFNYVQPFQHFSNTPSDGVNVYCFANKPEDHQPSGTCNFSRIDNATLNVTVNDKNTLGDDSQLNIYTVNYNVLRVMSGMAGTAYSN